MSKDGQNGKNILVNPAEYSSRLSKLVREEYSVKRVTPQLREKVADLLRQEVQIFSDYISGSVYGYVIEKDGEKTDSCWGFIGAYDIYYLQEARACVLTGEAQPAC